ncbi:glycoside hydrolase family 140 protein [Arthrobacter sp. NA-172]|uniref:glycoside hydrolase family 140 protein n=1 Tax=Arthrobacter sp. NA-172 TaxID=3367524 RepID=UPI0037551E59
MIAQDRPIAVSENGRFLQRVDGSPFFYLADTAWELLHRCTLGEAELYLRDRAAKGFTVVQTVLLAELDGLRVPDPSGRLPLHDEDPTRPNEEYFAHVDAVFEIAGSLGLTIGLLPAWGDKWNLLWGIGPAMLTPEGSREFGEYVGRRFAHRAVIWILGGDRPIETPEHLAIVRAMAEGVRAGDHGRNLMTAHTWGQHSTSEYYADESWLEFHTIQSGHGRNFENWRMIEADYARTPVMPCMDMEPAYEESADQIGNLGGGFLDDYDVRKSLYWALFAGAHGHTYGCWPVWQMWDVGRVPRMWVRMPWREALQMPGADQVRHAKNLLLSRPYFDRVPDQSMVLGEPTSGVHHVRATRDQEGSFAFIFLPAGTAVQLTLESIRSEWYTAWWFDPRTGAAHRIGEGSTLEPQTFTPPHGGPDWVLVIDSADADHPDPGSLSFSRR